MLCVLSTYIGPPPVNNVTASNNMTPASLIGFDIRIFWDVSYYIRSAKFS